MLDERLVHQVRVIDRFTYGWVENLFFQFCMDLKFVANLIDDRRLVLVAPLLLELVEIGKKFLNLFVIRHEHCDGVLLLSASRVFFSTGWHNWSSVVEMGGAIWSQATRAHRLTKAS